MSAIDLKAISEILAAVPDIDEQLVRQEEKSYAYAQASTGRRKGIKHTEETKEKMRAASSARVHSEETKAEMSKIHRKRVQSLTEEQRERMRQANVGSKRSEESKQKIREALARKPKLTCLHCSKLLMEHVMPRHIVVCKSNPDRVQFKMSDETRAKMRASALKHWHPDD